MGIVGLLPFLQEASRKCNIDEFRGCTVAIDTYCWLHKGAFACADKLVRGEDTFIHIAYCLKYIQLLLSNNIKPIMVFDGQHLPAKKETELKRREARKAARSRGAELLRLGKTEEARQCFRQCVDISHNMALVLIKECRNRNIDCIVAPYEADAQLAYLNMQGFADIVITEDSDLVLFGCNKILFKFAFDGTGILVEQQKLYRAMKLRPQEYTFDKFRYMCIMSGCDYLDSLPGIGLKRAHKAICMTANPDIYKLLPRLPRYLNLKNLSVPVEYLENFKIADATFRHQIVYDPLKRGLVRLTDPRSSGITPEYLKNAGDMYEDDKALQLAVGNIDPITLRIMDDWNPDVEISIINGSSIWAREKYTKLHTPTKPPTAFNISVKTSTKSKSATVSSAEILAAKEQAMIAYDIKLEEELKMYTTEPPSKRSKVCESPKIEENEEIDKPNLKSKIINPFLKSKSKGASKFGATMLEKDECIKSRFFSFKSKAEPIASLQQELHKDEVEIETCTTFESADEKLKTSSHLSNLENFIFNRSKKLSKPICLNSNEEKTDSNSDEENLLQWKGRTSPILPSSSRYSKKDKRSKSRTQDKSESSKLSFFKYRNLNTSEIEVKKLKHACANLTLETSVFIESVSDISDLSESDAETLTTDLLSDIDTSFNSPKRCKGATEILEESDRKSCETFKKTDITESPTVTLKPIAIQQDHKLTNVKLNKAAGVSSNLPLTKYGKIRNLKSNNTNQPTILSMFYKMTPKSPKD